MEIVCEIETNESNIMLILKQMHGDLIGLCQNTSSETFFYFKKSLCYFKTESLFEINSLKDMENTLQIPL